MVLQKKSWNVGEDMFDNLNKRVIFKKLVKTKDGRGGWTTEPQIIDTVWAGIDPLKADEILKYQAIYPGVDTKIIIRYHPIIDSFKNKCKAFYDSKFYDIKGMINPSESDRYLEFAAIEVVDKSG